jgi:hypothetical protein
MDVMTTAVAGMPRFESLSVLTFWLMREGVELAGPRARSPPTHSAEGSGHPATPRLAESMLLQLVGMSLLDFVSQRPGRRSPRSCRHLVGSCYYRLRFQAVCFKVDSLLMCIRWYKVWNIASCALSPLRIGALCCEDFLESPTGSFSWRGGALACLL